VDGRPQDAPELGLEDVFVYKVMALEEQERTSTSRGGA